MNPRVLCGSLEGRGTRIALVVSRFNDFIVERLVQGALDALERHGVAEKDVTLARVPGALEIPVAALALARTKKHDAIVALGCVIRGETSHYDIVAGESARAIMDISIALDMPVGNGILTVDTDAQAKARARQTGQDKGGGAARAALTLVRLKRKLGKAKR